MRCERLSWAHAPSTFVTHALEQPSFLARSALLMTCPDSSIRRNRAARCSMVSCGRRGFCKIRVEMGSPTGS